MVKVLLIEDNKTFREMFKKMLVSRFLDVSIVEAENCSDGLASVEIDHPDLIFTDIKLPDGNGLECIEKIKAIYPKIIIVVLSLSDFSEYDLAAKDAGALHYISKYSLNEPWVTKLLETLFLGERFA